MRPAVCNRIVVCEQCEEHFVFEMTIEEMAKEVTGLLHISDRLFTAE